MPKYLCLPPALRDMVSQHGGSGLVVGLSELSGPSTVWFVLFAKGGLNVTSLSENKTLIGRCKAYGRRIIPSTHLVSEQNFSPSPNPLLGTVLLYALHHLSHAVICLIKSKTRTMKTV